MTIPIDLVAVVSLAVVGLMVVWTVLLVVWCESAGEAHDYGRAPRARAAASKRRGSDRSAATSIERALVSNMPPGVPAADEERRSG